MGPPPPKVEEPEIKPYEDNYERYQTCAIPRQKIELNYQYAMARMMHGKNKKYLSTRRDMTIRQIQENIYKHNDPIGEGIIFEDFMSGKKSTMSQ